MIKNICHRGVFEFFRKHWRGEYSLARAYWLNTHLLAVAVFLLTTLVVPWFDDAPLQIISIVLLLIVLLRNVTYILAIRGAWMSAAKHVERGGKKVWANAAKFMLILYMLLVLLIFAFSFQRNAERVQMAFSEQIWPPVNIMISADKKSVLIEGGLNEGAASSLAKVLDEAPLVETIVFNSKGGWVREGMRMATLISGRKLNTHVKEECNSACTIAFMAGIERTAAPNAQLGFHQFKQVGDSVTRLEDKTLLNNLYERANLSKQFIAEIAATPQPGMWFPTQDELLKENVLTQNPVEVNNAGKTGYYHIDSIYKSVDYRVLKTELDKAEQRLKTDPANFSYLRERTDQQQKISDFKRDILGLSKDINKTTFKSKRLELVKQDFYQADYLAARTKLSEAELSQEQQMLLVKQTRLKTKRSNDALEINATEFIYKARLTAIDSTLPDRIQKSGALFEKALKSARTPGNLSAYADFLQDSQQPLLSKRFYQEALGAYRVLAAKNPAVYLPEKAKTLDKFGILLMKDSHRQNEAQTIYQEALAGYRQLATQNPALYLPDVANTLNTLTILAAFDPNRANAVTMNQEALKISGTATDAAVYLPIAAQAMTNLGYLNLFSSHPDHQKQAETWLKEALNLLRRPNAVHSADYLSELANTLRSLGDVATIDAGRQKQAEAFYQEALIYQHQLAAENPGVYLPHLAITLNNYANLLKNDPSRWREEETLLKEALVDYRLLSVQSPDANLPQIEVTLNNLGLLISNDSHRRPEAEAFFQEALRISRQIVADNPGTHLADEAMTLWGLGNCYINWHEPRKALTYLQEAATLIKPFAEQNPQTFGNIQTTILTLVEQAKN